MLAHANSKKAVEISFVDLNTGKSTKIWTKPELLNYLQISNATFKRDKALLTKYCPELQLAKRSKVFSDRHRHAFDALRDWREIGYSGESLLQQLQNEGLPPYVDYQTRVKEAPQRLSKRRRN